MFKGKVFLLVLIVVFFVVSLPGQSIVVTSPNSGNYRCINSSMRISWDKTGQMDDRVKIRLFNRSGTKILDIINNTPNDGSYNWNRIPSSIAHDFYVIRVKTLDDRVYDDSNAFIIMNCQEFDKKPEEERIENTITITIPNPFSTYYCINGSMRITWDKTGQMDGRVKIRLFDRSGTRILGITDNAPNSGTFNWNSIPISIRPGGYVIRVKTLDDRVQDDSDIFVINNCVGKNPAPEEERNENNLEITNPRGGERWIQGSSHTIRWDNSGDGNVKIEMLECRVIKLIYSGLNVGNWRWNINNYLDGSRILPGFYTLKITHLSNPGNTDTKSITILPSSR